jgi:tRNA wybutosine-synthesizing protein 4
MGVHNRPSQVKPNGVPKAKSKQDEAIIGTNDYSIVSKRSVEKLYCRDEPEFLRPFVHKFKRRAPLINRGYWLRERVIQAVVRRFLDEKTTSKSKAVVNLGCGYAPMPFRTMWKYPDKCRNVKFVDVDFPQLIKKKLEIMKNEPVFKELFNADIGQTPSHASILYESEKYCAIGCDLGHHNEVQRVLRDRLGLDCHSVLFIGEVSIVYMPPREATDLLELTSKFSDGMLP